MYKKIIKKVLRKISDYYETIANLKSKYPTENSLSGWSVVVITDGKSNNLVSQLISSVKNELQNSPYEIILVGPKNLNKLDFDKNFPIKKIIYRELNLPKVPGWITKKKNLGILNAKYDKVVVCHDYIKFNTGWKQGYDNFNDFQICSNIIIDLDGERSTDWMTWDYPFIGQTLLPYNKECSQYQYICGIYFVGKRDFLIKNPQLEKFRWGEAEDIEWSKSIRNRISFKVNTRSVIQFTKPKWKISPETYKKSLELEKILNS